MTVSWFTCNMCYIYSCKDDMYTFSDSFRDKWFLVGSEIQHQQNNKFKKLLKSFKSPFGWNNSKAKGKVGNKFYTEIGLRISIQLVTMYHHNGFNLYPHSWLQGLR